MWAKGIVVSFIVFVMFMIGLVVICLKQDIALENKDYYKKELEYQSRIDAIQNTKSQKKHPEVFVNSEGDVEVIFGDSKNLKGSIWAYKPDQSKQDFKQSIHGNCKLSMQARARGLWRFKVEWVQNETPYYYESPILIN